MATITVIQKDGTTKDITAEDGWSLMEILRDAGFPEIEGRMWWFYGVCNMPHVYPP